MIITISMTTIEVVVIVSIACEFIHCVRTDMDTGAPKHCGRAQPAHETHGSEF
jgi:hypothetical protein